MVRARMCVVYQEIGQSLLAILFVVRKSEGAILPRVHRAFLLVQAKLLV
jgi:hypothetical protein